MNRSEYIKAIIEMLERTPDAQLVAYIYGLLRECA